LNTGSLVNWGRPDGAMSVRPFAINDVGEFTGLVYWGVPGKDIPTPSAFLFSQGQWVFLGVFDADQYEHTWPRDMNSQGQIVGILEGLGPGKGFLWQNGELFMLNDLLVAGSGVNVTSAHGINDAGQITGTGYDPDGGALILTPVVPQGDLTLDCIVGPADLAQLLAHWGQCPTRSKCMADIAPVGGDGTVGPVDLAALLANWS
jgi:uncharacterized membrane protein